MRKTKTHTNQKQQAVSGKAAQGKYKHTPLGWIPKEWEVRRLDEVAKRGSGHTPNKSFPSYYNGGIKWISLADSSKLDDGEITETAIEISDEGISNSSAVLHRRGTVLLSRDAGVGMSAVMGEDMAVSQHFITWTCNSLLDNWYLYYYLQYKKPFFERMAVGSTIKTIGLSLFKKLEIPYPSLPEQRQIARILSTWDRAIKTVQQLIDKKQQRKNGLMQQLLTGKKRLPGFRGEWRTMEFGKFVQLSRSKHNPTKRNELPCIELEHLESNTGRLLGSVRAPQLGSTKHVFKKGQVLFGKLRPYLRKYWLAEFDGVCSSEIWVLDGVAKYCHNQYLFQLLQHPSYIRATQVSTGSKMPRADWYYVAEYPFDIPPVDEQQQIAAVLTTADKEIDNLKQQLAKLREQKKGLMQVLLTGRVRVNTSKSYN